MKAPALVIAMGPKHSESGPKHVDDETDELEKSGESMPEFDAFYDAIKDGERERARAAFVAAVEVACEHYRSEMEREGDEEDGGEY